MALTPDRKPGALEEDEEIRFVTNASPPTQAGSVNYSGTSFQMRDATGVFDPRSGGGITEGQHEVLDTLVHDIDETSYDEVTYAGSNVSSYIVWTTASKTKKVREETYTYASGKVSQVVTQQYDGSGVLKMTMTEDYTYSGNKVTSVTRVKT